MCSLLSKVKSLDKYSESVEKETRNNLFKEFYDLFKEHPKWAYDIQEDDYKSWLLSKLSEEK